MAVRMHRCWLVLLLPLALFVHDAKPHAPPPRIQGPSADFSARRSVKPRIYHARSKREITSTKESDTDHADVLSVGLELDGQSRVLDLRLNSDLIPAGYKERHQHRGDYKTHVPRKVELCHYQGSMRDMPGSWAAVSTCHGLKGVIFDGDNLHYIQPEQESLDSRHYLYKHSDLIANNSCGYRGTAHHIANELVAAARAKRSTRHKRASEAIRGPYNANRQSRYVELVLVVDKNEYTALGENLTRVHQHCKDIANIINALYTPLNIFIALIGVEVWTDADEIHLMSNGDTTLNNFLQYRRERLVKTIPNDNAQLLTKIQFDEGVVGKALKGPICTYEFSGGVSVDHSNVVGLVAATMAHEMGHNFGMEHDSSDCICPEERCIMAPSSGSSGPTHWSSCSLEYLALAFEHGMDYCLRNKPKRLFDSPICGNGFVEPGEQCDCGLVENCDNPCCDALTCMLHTNASCATGECCDLKTCKPKTAGTECRSADQECDLPEYCTGQSEYCPKDVFKIDGEACNMGKAYCYQGSCRTHNDQCKLLWGPTGSSSDVLCYDMNNKGTKNGNCGFNRTGNNYVKCHDQNVLCGMLHCKHLNERLEFGMESVSTLSHSFINSQGKIIACRSAIVDLGLNQVDPGLSPDGAKCAPGKMCVNQKCMPVAELRASFPNGKACPNGCSGNGVCNSLGHCHCNRGFQPPDCTQPGVGGSLDSGPADDPNARSEYVMSLYIIFLGIVPTIALVSFGVWYARNNGGGNQWKKATASNPISTLTRGFGFGGGNTHQQQPAHYRGSCSTGIQRSVVHPVSRGGEPLDSRGLAVAQADPACASLLPKSDTDERFNNNFFGQFKGFSITPLTTKESPRMRAAPAPPTCNGGPAFMATTVPIKTHIKPIQRSSSLRQAPTIDREDEDVVDDVPKLPPALPPPNVGSTAKPLISSPILAATTCTSVDLPKVPTRPAPDIPTIFGAGQSATVAKSVGWKVQPTKQETTVTFASAEKEKDKVAKCLGLAIDNASTSGESRRGPGPTGSSTLTRIASMLYPMVRSNSQNEGTLKYHTNSLPRTHHKASKMLDKEILRSLEISNPIPQKKIEILTATIPVKPELGSEQDKARNVVMRAQSMRDKVTPRPTIHSFGSMRQPNKRPTSIAATVRPTSPPPIPPVKVDDTAKKPALIIDSSSKTDNAYDDCMNLIADAKMGKIVEESPSNDNIYAVIEESLPEKGKKSAAITAPIESEYKTPKSIDPNAAGGLLSEIVSEISNRNFDSIYSTKTISPEPKLPNTGTYVNTPHYKSPANSVYSNSTTSSGYLSPSAVNVPPSSSDKPEIKDAKKETTSTVKPSYAPFKPTHVNMSIIAEKKKEEPKTASMKPGFSRTKTPPGIKKTTTTTTMTTTTTTTTMTSTTTNRPTSRQNSDSSLKSSKSNSSHTGKLNSPDLVSSCNSNTTNKSPDVLSKTKTSTLPKQKSVTTPPKPSNLATKTASFAEKPSAKSTVASLQQKFEQSNNKSATAGTLTRKKPSTISPVKK
ncbi:uncharacterized protein LOC131668128 [Phymastichus coffea]|uniref:uncharacterized protein LOC131668128 n=1 Tax=Phymastichus coffea TaxID=108790 RepID=UPI00273C019C|nr:uncharacterized protein LOC131668128 [Phymastichus coffea]